MPLPTDTTPHTSPPTHPGQQLADASTLRVFQPFKPPLRERNLTQTAIRMVLFLVAVIGCAAVMVWLFLPSMLPKLPLTFL